MGVSHNKGTIFWGPQIKDPTIWGTILGSPIFGNPQIGNPCRQKGLECTHSATKPRSLRAEGLGLRT